MKPSISVYLDVVRLGAALVVLFGHLSGTRFTAGLGWQFAPFMGDAVAIFFVLSGFVIAHVTSRSERNWRSYGVSRAARILSVSIAALLLTSILDAIGQQFDPGLYSSEWGFRSDHPVWRFFANLLFVNQIWTLDVSFGSDLPYWSLGFEVWYYVIFGLIIFAQRGWAWAVLACLLVGPRIAVLFPLWLCGLGCHRLCRRWADRQPMPWLFPACVFLMLILEGSGALVGWPTIEDHVLWVRPDVVRYYVIGTAFCLTVLALQRAPAIADRFALAVQAPVRWFAGATFSLYLFHLPIAQCLAAINPWGPASVMGRLLVLVGTVAAVLVLAMLTERRKDDVRLVGRYISRRVRLLWLRRSL